MFKKKAAQSTLKYCQRATELPYSRLVEHRRFTVALARTSQVRTFHSEYPPHAPRAMGVLDGAHTFPGGRDEPLLPVAITFKGESAGRDQPVGTGWMDQHYGQNESFFVLELTIADPGYKLFRAVERAVERAALSQERWVHLECRRRDWDKVSSENIAERTAKADDLLRAIEAGDASFPSVHFDEVTFREDLVLQAEPWAWAWPSFEQGGAKFRSQAVAKWRADRAKWFK